MFDTMWLHHTSYWQGHDKSCNVHTNGKFMNLLNWILTSITFTESKCFVVRLFYEDENFVNPK